MKRYPRTVVHIVWDAARKRWLATIGNRAIETATSRVMLTAECAARLDELYDEAGVTGQVVVHRKNGAFAFERTYPRSSDPRKSKG